MMKTEHCWHDDGRPTCMVDGVKLQPVTCCFCGEMVFRTIIQEAAPGHGPNAGTVNRPQPVNYSGACRPRESECHAVELQEAKP